ncbi:phosphotransferase [Chromatocurvus halotolerans]|uniref:Thiamine kinase-like enzyme n=1 Tax=Chromatocurvus halotolerans TaxID=1132028 RepID=A0A4R2KQZ3_9GAMM|nr:phosphotransferase [Chromatocurvus halotolerans]TCO76173.1 thiamine kinase-like enzyme [Chromatocurvus halotolerans]
MTTAPKPASSRSAVRLQAALQDSLRLVNKRRGDWSPAPGAGPVTLGGPLSPGGTSNHSFRVHAGDETLVLRIDGVNPARNAIHRDTEFRLHAAAAAAGLAPAPRFHDADAGVLLVDYLEPDSLPPLSQPADVAQLLRAIHSLQVADAPRLSLTARVAHYEALLRPRCGAATGILMQVIAPPLRQACQALDADAAAGVICHNDLTPANRLYHRGRLYALDWEYAACGSCWFDLAVASEGPFAATALLQAYLQRPVSVAESALFRDARRVARYLELLWFACNAAIDEPQLQDGLRDLSARLADPTPAGTCRAI